MEDEIRMKLKRLRRERMWSMLETSRRLGWSKSKYARIESSNQSILVRDLQQIADLFDVSLVYFTGTQAALDALAQAQDALHEIRKRVDPDY